MMKYPRTITREMVKAYIVEHYKHERLFGRTAANGWDDGYGDRIVDHYLESCLDGKRVLISKHESRSGWSEVVDVTRVLQHYAGHLSGADLEEEYKKHKKLIASDAMQVSVSALNSDDLLMRSWSEMNAFNSMLRQQFRKLIHFGYVPSRKVTGTAPARFLKEIHN